MLKAEHDQRTALAALEQTPPITDTAGFHVQQAIEKLLKAYLVFQGAEIGRGHDLGMLCEECARYDSSFSNLCQEAAPLTAYAVQFRYPGPTDPSAEQVRNALAVLEQVKRIVTDRIP